MTLQNMRYIIEAANCQSFSRAAQSLFMTQSALSTAIKETEEELGIQIFRRRGADKGVRVLLAHNHGHALLGLRNGKLRTVKAVIFFRYRVKINVQTRSKLTDGHGNAACAKVIAPFYKQAHRLIAEQPLYFTFLHGIAFLPLCGRRSHR